MAARRRRGTRLSEALASLRAKPAADFFPFDPTTALDTSLIGACAAWPDASPPPPPPGPLPDVPTLILSGAQDLRTPTSNARRVAEQIPDAAASGRPLHRPLGARQRLQRLRGARGQRLLRRYSGAAVRSHRQEHVRRRRRSRRPSSRSSTRRAPWAATPVARSPPCSTRSSTSTARCRRDASGRPAAPERLELRRPAGRLCEAQPASLVLNDLSFVTGVRLSGTFPVKDGRLQTATIRVSGPAAAPGPVRSAPPRRSAGRSAASTSTCSSRKSSSRGSPAANGPRARSCFRSAASRGEPTRVR